MNASPAAHEITGTQKVSAAAETLGAPIAVWRRYPGLDDPCGVALEENRYRDSKGWFRASRSSTQRALADMCGFKRRQEP
jgi:hypothetical protein